MLGENVLSKPLHAGTVSNINLKSGSPSLGSSPLSGSKVNVNTKHITPMRPNRESGSPPNPTPSPSDKSQLPPQLPLSRTNNPTPPKLPRSSRTPKMIDKLGNHPSNNGGPMPNRPVLPNDGPPPKPLTP